MSLLAFITSNIGVAIITSLFTTRFMVRFYLNRALEFLNGRHITGYFGSGKFIGGLEVVGHMIMNDKDFLRDRYRWLDQEGEWTDKENPFSHPTAKRVIDEKVFLLKRKDNEDSK